MSAFEFIWEIVMLIAVILCSIIFLKSAITRKTYRMRSMRILWGVINVIMCCVWAFDIFMNGTMDFEIILITMIAMLYVDKLLSDKWVRRID